ARVAMVVAVMTRRARLALAGHDVYVATVGGVRLGEPAADLATALAVAGAVMDRPLASGTVAFGEVGLAGEVRPVTGLQRRLAEAARLGFTAAVVPRGTSDALPAPEGMRVLEVADVASAMRQARLHAL
ncbi:MAG: magnesium chelatase domain-containing protein, partial [Actinomycetota bacterium]